MDAYSQLYNIHSCRLNNTYMYSYIKYIQYIKHELNVGIPEVVVAGPTVSRNLSNGPFLSFNLDQWFKISGKAKARFPDPHTNNLQAYLLLTGPWEML